MALFRARGARIVAAIAVVAAAAAARAQDAHLAAVPQPGVRTGAAAPPATPTLATTLRSLAAHATLIVVAQAGAAQERDQGRILVHPLKVERVVAGSAPAADELVLVELRGASTRPPLLAGGTRAVLLLAPAADVSYLREHVGEAGAVEAPGGRDGLIAVTSADDEREVVVAVERARAARSALQQRAHAFALLAASHPRLVEDGAHELSALLPIGRLSQRELDTLAIPLRNASLPAATREKLLDALGRSNDRRVAAVLEGAFTESARLLEAALRSRARLGAPASADELDVHLGSPDTAVRAAALRVLAPTRHPHALTILTAALLEAEPRELRLAAIDALGELGDARAASALATAFESDDRGIKQAAARGLLGKGEAGSETLVELALRGRSTETRTYAAMLLLTRHSREHPLVQRLAASQPSPDVAHVLARGMQDTHAHEH